MKTTNPNAKTIKNLRKATCVYIHTLRKASKSQWFPDIKAVNENGTALTVQETLVECMDAIDQANQKFAK
jgi:hypothetical protein